MIVPASGRMMKMRTRWKAVTVASPSFRIFAVNAISVTLPGAVDSSMTCQDWPETRPSGSPIPRRSAISSTDDSKALGLWIADNKGAKFWLSVMNELSG